METVLGRRMPTLQPDGRTMRGKGDVKAPGGGRMECPKGHRFDAATDNLVRFEGGRNKPL